MLLLTEMGRYIDISIGGLVIFYSACVLEQNSYVSSRDFILKVDETPVTINSMLGLRLLVGDRTP